MEVRYADVATVPSSEGNQPWQRVQLDAAVNQPDDIMHSCKRVFWNYSCRIFPFNFAVICFFSCYRQFHIKVLWFID